MTIVVLAGGVGAARFLEGVVQCVAPETVAAVINTGDDRVFHGLLVSPDVDIVTYTLAGMVDVAQGWGVVGDTTATLDALTRLGSDTWFKLGDKDLATHIRRHELAAAGRTPTQIADAIRRALGVAARILPMTDDPVATHIDTPAGRFHFQEYLVKRHMQDEVLDVAFVGAEAARPTPEVLAAIAEADAILIAPSNPIVSVGTILAVPGMRAALNAARARVIAVSPIIGGAAVKGPAAPLMRGKGYAVSALGVAQCYAGLVDGMVIDDADRDLAAPIRALGMDVTVMDTLMRGPAEKRALAQAALALASGAA